MCGLLNSLQDCRPTPRAIEEHIKTLKRMSSVAGGGGGAPTSTPKKSSTPRKPSAQVTPSRDSTRKATASKIPPTSNKRKASKSMSNEDDTDDEQPLQRSLNSGEVAPREKWARPNKSSKVYREMDTDDEADEARDKDENVESSANADLFDGASGDMKQANRFTNGQCSEASVSHRCAILSEI